jgi:DNA polymerase elongation subunit (family B)
MKYFIDVIINPNKNYGFGFPDPSTAIYRINSILLYDIYSNEEIVFSDIDERLMIISYLEFVKDSFLFGYNILSFDIPYLKKRCDILDIELPSFDIRCMLNDFQNAVDLESYILPSVIDYITGKRFDYSLDDVENYKIIYNFLYKSEVRDDKLERLFK